MTDATILIPTHDHASLLPFAIRSALAQEGPSIELFIVGDGVGDDTRGVVEPFLDDERVRFFDGSKGERHGERLRHAALQEATGSIVCYVGDDDLVLRDHVATMSDLLASADLAHSAPAYVEVDGALTFLPMDISRPEFRELLLSGAISFSLTGAAHRLETYGRLPHGWRPAPPGVWTDLYMWQQFLRSPGAVGVTSRRLTHLHFPSPARADWSVERRVAELEDWERRGERPSFSVELQAMMGEAVAVAGENHRLAALSYERVYVQAERDRSSLAAQLGELRATRTFRLRERLIRIRLLRALLGRSRGAR